MWCPWHVKDNTMNVGGDWRRFGFIMIHILTVWSFPAEMVTGLGGATLLLASSHVALFIAAMAEVLAVLLLQTAGWHPGGDT